MTQDELIAAVLRLSGTDLPEGVSADDVESFESKLRVSLPPLLCALLCAANGGESILANHGGNFVPDTLADLDYDALWDHVLEPIAELTGDTFSREEFVDHYLPLGSDFSGEAIVIDLKSAPYFRVLRSNGEGANPQHYEEDAATLESHILNMIEAFSKPPAEGIVEKASATLPQDDKAIQYVQSLFTEKITGERWKDELWFVVRGTYRFRLRVKVIPVANFGSFLLHTRATPTLVTRGTDGFVVTTYKNVYVINDVMAAIGRDKVQLSPFDFERCRVAKTSPDVHIYETDFKQMLAPRTTGFVSVGVFWKKDDQLHWLRFDLEDVKDQAHANAAINELLGQGEAWLRVPG